MYILRIFALIVFSSFMSDGFAVILSKEATYYADSFEWSHTSNGEVFSQDAFTAAMCDIPLGKNVYVSSGDTGALVRVNDRPNCSRYPNIIDLSKKSFSLFAPLSTGRIQSVEVDTLATLNPSYFRDLWVELSPDTPSVYFAGDGTEIRGRVTDGKSTVLVFLQNQETKEEYSRLFPVNSDGTFSQGLTLPNLPGKYSLVVASGNSFKTVIFATIRLVSPEKFLSSILPSPSINRIIPRIEKKWKFSSISLWDRFYGKLELRQDIKKFQLSWTSFIFDNFSSFRPGKADVNITGYTIGSGWSLDQTSWLSVLFTGTVLLDRVHESTGKNLVNVRTNKQSVAVKFRVPSTPKIRGTYYLTFPNGDIREFDYNSTFVSEEGFLIPGKMITLALPMPDNGTYMLEAVRSDGIAYFNFPINRGAVWNIIQPYPTQNPAFIQTNSITVTNTVVNHINKLRAGLGRWLLSIDPDYSKLAQAKVDDMIRRNYHAHQDPDGLYVGSLAQRIGLTNLKSFRENIAYGQWEVNDIILQDGLEESGSHRFAMLMPEYRKIGVGYARKWDKTYLVHIIGE